MSKGRLIEQGEEEYCENCGRPMVLKKGRFGTFFACSGYPDCKTTKQIGATQQEGGSAAREKCPQVRQQPGAEEGRFGEFTACWQLSRLQVRQAEDHRCEVPGVLEGEIIERRSARARPSTAATAIPTATSWPGASPCREVPRVRQLLHGREVAQGGPGLAVSQRGVQAPGPPPDGRAVASLPRVKRPLQALKFGYNSP